MGLLDDEYTYDNSGDTQGTARTNPDTGTEWSGDFDSSFELDGSGNENPDYWNNVWEFANTELGMGIIGGVAGGIQQNMAESAAQDRYDKSRTDALTMQEQQLAMQERAIALQESALADKTQTRARHNVSINKPSPTRRKAKYGGRT